MLIRRILLVILVAMATACSAVQPVNNVVNSPVPAGADGELLSMQQVEKAIVQAATYKRWNTKSLDEDTIEASITVRERHHATVNIDYSPVSYSITLQSSIGLDEEYGKIHRNYNKWIILLDQQIQEELLK